MTHLDPAGERLLQVLAQDRPDAFVEVAPTSGTNRAQTLTVTVDAAKRVIDVQVLDIGGLRHPEPFETALSEAFFAADGERLYAVLQLNGQADEWIARADRSLAGGGGLKVRNRGPEIVTRAASLERRAARGARPAPRRRPAAGHSDNGFLTVQRSARGDLAEIQVDADWLGGARSEHLELAILQATRYSLGD